MLASTLISQLTTLIEKFGDKEVNIFADIVASQLNINATTHIEEVEYDDTNDDIFLRADYHRNNNF